MVLYSPDWKKKGFSFILLAVNLFHHFTCIEHRLYIRVYSRQKLNFDCSKHPCEHKNLIEDLGVVLSDVS